MALHPDFPISPYEVLPPEQRWFPAAEKLRDTAYEKLLPPLVAKIRSAASEWRPFRTAPRGFLPTKKSVFNKIIGEGNADGLELNFAAFLEGAPDVQAFGKNYMAVGFKPDYVKANGDLSTYTPDFVLRTTDAAVWVVETKGREELDVPQKLARLRQWCADATEASKSESGTRYGFVYVDQENFEQYKPSTFAGLASTFREYQEVAS